MEIVSFISGVITDRLRVLLAAVTDEFGNEIKQVINNNILEYQVEAYKRNFETKTLLHRIEPKKLLDFYHPLHIRKMLSNGERSTVSTPTDEVRNLFHKHPYITLIGAAGSGKSTIIKYLFVNAFDANFKIPVTIELRYLNDYSGTLTDYIREKVFKLHKIATNDRIIERLLSSGQFIFFLDGYDEIAAPRKHAVTREITDLVSVYFRNYYLLTSRPFASIDLLPQFHNFEVCSLSADDIDKFIKKQIPKENVELTNKMITAVNSFENRVYKSFLENPLLLSMFILTFQSYSTIPQLRSDFFYQVFDTLYSVHDSMTKVSFVRDKESGLSKEAFVEVLRMFSFISYFEDKFVFSASYLEKQLGLIKSRKPRIVFENEKLINDLQVATGILIKDGIEYSFPHRALQEYFAACYVAGLNDANKKAIYTKIFGLHPDNQRLASVERDNFLVLLTELDMASFVMHGLAPYLRQYAGKDYKKMAPEEIIECFNSLSVCFKVFNNILPGATFHEFGRSLPELSNTYHALETEIFNRAYKKRKTVDLEARTLIVAARVQKRIARKDARYFLVSFTTSLKESIRVLEDSIWQENKSDEETIAMI